MKYLKILSLLLASVILLTALSCSGFYFYLEHSDGSFLRDVPEAEKQLRLELVNTAEKWLDMQEGSVLHQRILYIYNGHEPLAQGYEVKLEDNWCATYASAMAILCDMTDIIPTECGCERQVALWQAMGRWEENDLYRPLAGDYIYYAWDDNPSRGDCTGWSDHVGIVVETAGPFIKVIEGNKDDAVGYRIISRYHPEIRGFGLPDFASKIK